MKKIILIILAAVFLVIGCKKEDSSENNPCDNGEQVFLKRAFTQYSNGQISDLLYSYDECDRLIEMFATDEDTKIIFNYDNDKLTSMTINDDGQTAEITINYTNNKVSSIGLWGDTYHFSYDDNDITIIWPGNYTRTSTYTIVNGSIVKLVEVYEDEIIEENWLLDAKNSPLKNINLPMSIKILLHDDLEQYFPLVGSENCYQINRKRFNKSTMELIDESTILYEIEYNSNNYPVSFKEAGDDDIVIFSYISQ